MTGEPCGSCRHSREAHRDDSVLGPERWCVGGYGANCTCTGFVMPGDEPTPDFRCEEHDGDHDGDAEACADEMDSDAQDKEWEADDLREKADKARRYEPVPPSPSPDSIAGAWL